MRRAIVVLVLGLAATAWAGFGKLKGQIVITDESLPSMDDEDAATAALIKANKTTLERPTGSDRWSFHCVAFADRKPGTTTLNLLFYDVTGKDRKYLTSKEITIGDASATVVVTDVEISEDDGIKPGHKIEIFLARVVGDREIDLAKAKVTFTAAK